MREYFIVANSFAAPFFSDDSKSFVTAETPEDALTQYVADYTHPAGLYSAVCFASADAYHKGEPHLAQWLCNHEIEKMRLSAASKGGYTYLGHGPGVFETNGTLHTVADPKGGRIVK